MKADLHIHSKHSFDGELEVSQIIQQAKEKNLHFIAITDHNEVAGSLELLNDKSIRSMSGIEIDCFDGEIVHHILGYGCDLNQTIFQDIKNHYIKELHQLTNKRITMFNKLFSIDLSIDKIKEQYPVNIITNVQITKYMFEHTSHPAFLPYTQGEKRHNPLANFYWDYCSINKPAYVSMNLPATDQIIDIIHQTGGIAIIAHPMIMGVNLSYYNKLDQIDGIEAYSSYHSSNQIQEIVTYANNRNILITGGSDYHGINKPNISLGQSNEPDDGSDVWMDVLLERIQ